jgi:hypothetical protein
MPIDDRTANRNYKLPNAGNFLADDVQRLRDALTAIDADVFARYTKTETDQKLADLINGAPGALDTLNELAAAMGNDPNFAATITNALAGKPGFADVWTRTQADARYVQGINQTENVFAGTGSQTTFTLTQTPPTRESLLVTVDGVVQPTTAYNLSGSALILSEAPASGASIRVLMLGVAGPVQSASTLNFTQAGTGAVTRTVDSKLKDIVSVKDFGAVGDGVANDTAAFNSAAATGKTVFIPAGSYVISTATSSAHWVLDDGAYVSGLPDINPGTGGGILNDTSRLTGRVLNLTNVSGYTGIRLGSGNPWMEKTRSFTESISEFAVTSATGQIAILGASRTEDNPAANFAGIGLAGYGVNTNTANPEPSWAAYLEARRASGTGPALGAEIDVFSGSAVYPLDPYNSFSTGTSHSVNLWLTAGGGDTPAGQDITAGIVFHPNPSKFYRGIVVRSGALDPTFNEVIAAPTGTNYGWYTTGNTRTSRFNDREIQLEFSSNSDSPEFNFIRKRASAAASQSLDTIHIAYFKGWTGSTEYTAGFTKYLQRGNFSGGHARFSYDIQVKNSGGTDAQVTLNGQGDNSFAPGADNVLNLGVGSARWAQVYAATGTINTSDEREKQDIADLDEAEKRVAATIKGLVRKFRFKDAVAAKGSQARFHCGVIAQDVITAFASQGLDASHYGILCYDEWEDLPEVKNEDGEIIQHHRPAGNRYGIRYEELLAFVLAAL